MSSRHQPTTKQDSRCYFVFEASLLCKTRSPAHICIPETVPSLVEDAVKYIIFLVDADSLFDLALGMYDFSLVLMIAQHAQKVQGMNSVNLDTILILIIGSTRISTFPSRVESFGKILPAVPNRRPSAKA